MGTARRGTGLVLLVLALVASGCEQADQDRLMRVGNRIRANVDATVGSQRDQLGTGWQALLTSWQQVSLDARVTARLRWDKGLEGAAIHAHADGETVKLSGSVRDLEQRRRAVEVAGSTIGVQHVLDELQGPAAQP
jgi:hypothetical protein